VTDTPLGMNILDNFIDICQCKREWSPTAYTETIIKTIREKCGSHRKVFLLVSGGVDSSVAFALLTKALGQFFAVAEAYPDLKANQGFLQLQSRISELESQIADRRELYNDTVAIFNTRLGQIPDKWVASWLSLTAAELFHAEEADREDVEIKFALAG
jgi:hypothetical protein